MKTCEFDAVEDVRNRINELAEQTKKSLMIAAMSGLDNSRSTTEHFRSPHVGSHPNMLFKRAIMTSGQPVVLFLDSQKFDSPFAIGACFSVFGPDLPWTRARRPYPIAICVAWEPEETTLKKNESLPERQASDLTELKRMGFDWKYAFRRVDDRQVVIAANDPFKKLLPAD